MKIAVGSDHRGFKLKKEIKKYLPKTGCKIVDVGCFSEDSVDYPDYALKVCRAVKNGTAEKGILICGTGIGMSISANKFSGIRAALVLNNKMAKMASEHNNANVLCLTEDTKVKVAKEIIKIWLKTKFSGGRYLRRIKKISAIEYANKREK